MPSWSSPIRTGAPKAAPGAATAAHSSRVVARRRNDHATTASPEALIPACTDGSVELPVAAAKSFCDAPKAAPGAAPRDADLEPARLQRDRDQPFAGVETATANDSRWPGPVPAARR